MGDNSPIYRVGTDVTEFTTASVKGRAQLTDAEFGRIRDMFRDVTLLKNIAPETEADNDELTNYLNDMITEAALNGLNDRIFIC